MKYHAFVVKGNLLIRIKDKVVSDIEKKQDVVILKNNTEIIGYNLLNVNLQIEDGLVKDKALIHDFVVNRTQNNELVFDETPYFVVGKVLQCEKHSQSSKLSITKVDVKDEILSIICKASNIRSGLNVVVAKVGAVLADGTWIKAGELLKVASQGMICSAKELGFNSNTIGIMELDNTFNIGDAFYNEN